MSSRAKSDGYSESGGPAPAAGTLVLALGNPLRGDDGVGLAVLGRLAANATFPDDVTLLDSDAMALDMLFTIHRYHQVVIVDAGNLGQNPGAWGCFPPDRLAMPACGNESCSVHNAGLAEALAVGKKLNLLPSSLVIYVVQPSTLDWSRTLSEPVKQAVPEVCAHITNRIGNRVGHHVQSSG